MREPSQLRHLAGQRAQVDGGDLLDLVAVRKLAGDDVEHPGHFHGEQLHPEARIVGQNNVPAHRLDQVRQGGHLMPEIVKQAPRGAIRPSPTVAVPPVH